VDLLQEMMREGRRPDAASFATTMEACSRAGERARVSHMQRDHLYEIRQIGRLRVHREAGYFSKYH
jgi:hypothetical protein